MTGAGTPTLNDLARAAEERTPEVVLNALHDLLWPPEEPDRQWEGDTIEWVAEMVDAYFPGRVDAKQEAAERASEPR